MSYSGAIRVTVDTDGLILYSKEKQVTGRTSFGPARIHLRAGEVARNITIAKPLPTQPMAAPSHFLIATDRPGVRFRLSSGEGSPTCRANGLLVTGAEDIFQATGSAPYWEEGTWQNGLSELQIDAVDGGQVNYAGTSWESTGDGSVQQACFSWGPDNYVDLGRQNDGKQFRFWLKVSSIDATSISFESFPYGSNATDESVEGSITTSTSGYVEDPLMLNRFSCDISSQLTANKWCLVVVNKSDFTATASAIWSRINQLRIVNEAAGATVSGSGIYFGDPPDSLVQSARIVSNNVTTRTALNLSLDAPATTDANVLVIGLIE